MASPAMTLTRRLVGFSTLPFLASVLPLLALPLVSRAASTDDWAAMNIGLGVGAFAAAVGLVGWNILGTPLVAMAGSPAAQRDLYGRSFFIRIVAVAIASALSALVAGLISPSASWPTAAAFAIASALNGIGLSWYAVGVSSPRIALLYEVVPRALATALSIAVVLLTNQVLWYGLLLCASVVVGTLAFHLAALHRILPHWPGWSTLRGDVADMRAAWGVESINSLYQNAPVPITGIVASSTAAAAFSSSDKIFRYGTLAVSAAGNALQGWVLETRGPSRRRRNLATFVIMGAVAAIGWVVLAVLGPWLSGWMFGADKQGDPAAFHFFGIAFVAISLSTPLIRNILIPARRDRTVFVITLVAAIVGIGAMVLAGASFGIAGVAAGFAASEVIMFVSCLVLTVRVGLDHHEVPRATDAEEG
ncbi:PST family polysaccharide transporter [Microbacterium foliorum]|uniref:lipopolysaccharide biosynthesis protein n=1 Tax=Microbacterium foliorum TaxID=104336 RepID=UPI00209D850E|nr:hypothetical protein [Microbacterium foliorum]MCP1429493.1 PST family polysaccharide transporter [Microbacterium foliorum]